MDPKLAAALIDGYTFEDCVSLLAACAPDILAELRAALAGAEDPADALRMARDALHRAYKRERFPN